MNEKEAREILSFGSCETDSICCRARGYLEAIEKAKGLEEVLRFIYESDQGPIFDRVAKEAISKWEAEK